MKETRGGRPWQTTEAGWELDSAHLKRTDITFLRSERLKV